MDDIAVDDREVGYILYAYCILGLCWDSASVAIDD